MFLLFPSHLLLSILPWHIRDTEVKYLSCSLPLQAHFFSVIFRKADDLPPSPLSLIYNLFPIPQINEKQHELEDGRQKQENKTYEKMLHLSDWLLISCPESCLYRPKTFGHVS